MRDSTYFDAVTASDVGRHDVFRGDGTAASKSNTTLVSAGVLGPGTYDYPADFAGCGTMRGLFNATTLTGTVSATLYATEADGQTIDTTVAGVAAALAVSTLVPAVFTPPAGTRIVLLRIVVAAASSVGFGVAEFTAGPAAGGGGGSGTADSTAANQGTQIAAANLTNTTLGAKADAAYTDATLAAAGSAIALFKGIFGKLAAKLGITVAANDIADGANVLEGAKADAAWDGAAASPTRQAIQKYMGAKLEAIRALLAAKLGVTIADGDHATFGALASAVWDGAAASVTAMSYFRYIGTKIEAIRASWANVTIKNANTAAVQGDPALVTRNPDIGTIADAAYTDITGGTNGTVEALLKGQFVKVHADLAQLHADATDPTFTSQVSVTSSVLPPNAAQASNQPGLVAKTTQGATFVPTQDAKDSGRSHITIFASAFATPGTADAMVTSLSVSVDGAAPTTGLTTYNVTTGKRFRITSIRKELYTSSTNTTSGISHSTLRTSTSGAVSTSSNSQGAYTRSHGTGANNAGSQFGPEPIPEGWELPSLAGIGVSIATPTWVATVANPLWNIVIRGYEY